MLRSDHSLQAQLNAKLARRQRELEEEEAERKRKDAAAAKLRALDEAIAAREAERYAGCSSFLREHLLTWPVLDLGNTQ